MISSGRHLFNWISVRGKKALDKSLLLVYAQGPWFLKNFEARLERERSYTSLNYAMYIDMSMERLILLKYLVNERM